MIIIISSSFYSVFISLHHLLFWNQVRNSFWGGKASWNSFKVTQALVWNKWNIVFERVQIKILVGSQYCYFIIREVYLLDATDGAVLRC